MNQFIESLFRLYKDDKISLVTLNKMMSDKKIDKQEYEYVISAKQAT